MTPKPIIMNCVTGCPARLTMRYVEETDKWELLHGDALLGSAHQFPTKTYVVSAHERATFRTN